MTLALQVTGLGKRFGAVQALRGVSLGLERGERLVLVGPQGSGRSALIRCLTRTEDFDEGEVRIAGEVLPAGGAALGQMRRRLGVVWPEAVLFPHFTALQNCAWALVRGGGLPLDEAEAVARVALDRVGMGDRGHARPDALGAGEQRRVAIARAIAQHPEVMLLDAPTADLNRPDRSDVRAVLVGLARAGATMLCATDDMTLARQMADRVLYLERGRVIETAPAARFFAGPSSAHARAFLQRHA